MSKKHPAVREHIRSVERFLRKWDPIGVIADLLDDGLPPSEYDTYAPYIVGLLQRGASEAELYEHLRYSRVSAMGLAANDEADRIIAKEIAAWWRHEQSAR